MRAGGRDELVSLFKVALIAGLFRCSALSNPSVLRGLQLLIDPIEREKSKKLLDTRVCGTHESDVD